MFSLNRIKSAGMLLPILALILITGLVQSAALAQTPGGTVISNQAHGTYADENGNSYQASSQTVTVTVISVSILTVTPDETASSATAPRNQQIIRTFSIINSGNTNDSYTISNISVTTPAEIAGLFYDLDNSGTVTPADRPIILNSTVSPQVLPHQSIKVLAQVNVGSSTTGNLLTIDLTAHSVADPARQDSGKIINTVGSGVMFGAPDDASALPLKLVDNHAWVPATTGEELDYTISFENHGDEAGIDAVVLDDLPSALHYVNGSLIIGTTILSEEEDGDGASVVGQRIKIIIPRVEPHEAVYIRFKAVVVSSLQENIVNTGSINGTNFQRIGTSAAIASINPYGVVFAGHSGGTTLINNARLSIAISADGTPITLSSTGINPNAGNQNPFATVADGRFNFLLGANQIGTPTAPASYVLRAEAAGFRSRLVGLDITPNAAQPGLYMVTMRALDGQPLAQSGTFTLTTDTVQINDLAALGFNLPMFENTALTIDKSADRPSAEIGDVVTYRVNVQNPTQQNIQNLTVRDELPEDLIYADGSAQIQISGGAWQSINPAVSSKTLTFNTGALSGGARFSLSYRTRVGASAKAGKHINTAVAHGEFANGETIETAAAQAVVRINDGVFANRQIVIGRVFEDKNGNGKFDGDDVPVGGARIYTNKGQAVVTDSLGMYNLPALSDGALTIALDKISLPEGYAIAGGKRKDERGYERLLRTPLLGGTLLHQDFAVTAPKLGAKNSALKLVETKFVKPEAELEKPAIKAALKSGTFELDASEKIAPVEPGRVDIISPKQDEVIMSPALELEARVAEGWQVALSVNDIPVSSDNISLRRLFNASKVEAMTFVGINLKAGPNKITVKAIGPDGKEGVVKEITVMGRGPVKKLEFVTEKKELHVGGSDTAKVVVRATDAWGNPAADTQVAFSISKGKLQDATQTAKTAEPANAQTSQVRQQILNLKDGFSIAIVGADDAPGEAEMKALAGDAEARSQIYYLPELRPNMLVGYADGTFGRSAPVMDLRGVNSRFYGRLGFFYRGSLFGNNLLTLSYDSERALNRTLGRDRLFEQDPLDRAYNVFGDSSLRFEDAQSNSKLYARLDHGRSYAMFGDFETEMNHLTLGGYSRRSNGVKLHLENSKGDFVSITGARPNTAYARDVFPGSSLGLIALSHSDMLQGSEIITLETRDRRNPEVILSSEKLIRSVDYNLDPVSGQIFFLRPLASFDSSLNLVQAIVTYEYQANGNSSNVYTAQASKRINSLGLRFGGSLVNQRQDGYGSFYMGGFNGEKDTFNGGKVRFEYALSRGQVATAGNLSPDTTEGETFSHNGNAFRVELEQPLKFERSVVKASFARADAKFFNPFGATVTPGSQRANISIEMKPRTSSQLKLGFTNERNKTENVDNNRSTASLEWTEQISEKLRARVGYDFRHFSDEQNDKVTNSNLVSLGLQWKPTAKLELAATREQNLTDADPTYPNQTTIGAKYQLNSLTKLFFTQRLASDAIKPISDVSVTGFGASAAKTETAFGIESKLFRFSSLNGRYQIENGVNGKDSFAVIGLQNRFAVSKKSAIEAGFERGFHVAGNGKSFNSLLLGYSWTTDGFRTSSRFELRDKTNFGNIFTTGAAGKIGDNITVLGRYQFANGKESDRQNTSQQGTLSFALRPLKSDKVGLLFSYNMRSLAQKNSKTFERTTDRSDTLSADGLYQFSKNFEIYGRFAAKFGESSRVDLVNVGTLTYLAQGRAQYKFADNFDIAFEAKFLNQPASGTSRFSRAAEIGYWLTPDMRFAVGYNLSGTNSIFQSATSDKDKSGTYFNVTTKLSRLFNLFDAKKKDQPREPEVIATADRTEK